MLDKMTISARAYNGIKLRPGTILVPFNGKLRVRSTVKPTGDVPFFDLIKGAEAAAMSMRRCAFNRRSE